MARDHQCRVYAEVLGSVLWTSEIAALGLRGKQDIVSSLVLRIALSAEGHNISIRISTRYPESQ